MLISYEFKPEVWRNMKGNSNLLITVYIGNFGSNNAKGKIKNAVLNKCKVLRNVKQ